jgi:short-subunit dehydrogenase
MRLTSGTVVITGGSAGIGKAAARAFAARGMNIAILARDEDRLEQTELGLSAFPVKVATYSCDVGDAEAVAEAASKAERELGPVTVWVNNAMTTVIKPFSKMTPEDVRAVTETTYLGQVHGMMAAYRLMKPRGEGAIVNVGSGLAYRAVPLQSAYCAAKHAVKAMSESLRTELIHEGSDITVSMVHPSGINTPQFGWAETSLSNRPQPMPPIYQPETVAKAIVRAAESGTRELFVGLPALAVWFGSQTMPRLLDRQLASSGWDDQSSDQETTDANTGEGYHLAPADGPAAAHGAYDDQAKDEAAIVDGDLARLAIAGAGALAAGSIGFMLGRLRGR